MIQAETYLPRIHLTPNSEGDFSHSDTGQHHQLTTSIERSSVVRVPKHWKEILPHEQFVTVLPMSEAANFRTLCQTASFTERPDGNYDVIGILRHSGLHPVWLTAIKYPKIAVGYLDFGSTYTKDTQPNIMFSILYGHPDTIDFNWENLFKTLETQFHENGTDHKMRKSMERAWRPHLYPLAKAMDSLETSASAVIFTGENGLRGSLANIGIKKFPILTPLTSIVLDQIWPSIPYVVNHAGWFAKIGQS